jgi:ribonuclease HI
MSQDHRKKDMAVGSGGESTFSESEVMGLIKGLAQTVDLEVYNMSVQGTSKKLIKQHDGAGSPRSPSPGCKKQAPPSPNTKIIY